MDRFYDHLRIGNRRGVQGGSAPGNIQWHAREIDDASIAAIAAKIVRGAHEDAIDRAGLDAQCTKHALRVIDRVARNLEALAAFNTLFANVDAIYWARFGALVARDARREIEAMEPAITTRNWYGQLGILKVFRERLALWAIRFQPSTERDPHAMAHGVNRVDHIAHPGPKRLQFIDHWAAILPDKLGNPGNAASDILRFHERGTSTYQRAFVALTVRVGFDYRGATNRFATAKQRTRIVIFNSILELAHVEFETQC